MANYITGGQSLWHDEKLRLHQLCPLCLSFAEEDNWPLFPKLPQREGSLGALLSVLSSLLSCPFVPNCLFVFFFQWPRIDAKSERLARFLITTILHGIWKFRNKATFHNGHDNSRAIIRYIITDIRNCASVDHFRLSHSDFISAWVSPVVSVSDTSYQVLIRYSLV